MVSALLHIHASEWQTDTTGANARTCVLAGTDRSEAILFHKRCYHGNSFHIRGAPSQVQLHERVICVQC